MNTPIKPANIPPQAMPFIELAAELDWLIGRAGKLVDAIPEHGADGIAERQLAEAFGNAQRLAWELAVQRVRHYQVDARYGDDSPTK